MHGTGAKIKCCLTVQTNDGDRRFFRCCLHQARRCHVYEDGTSDLYVCYCDLPARRVVTV